MKWAGEPMSFKLDDELEDEEMDRASRARGRFARPRLGRTVRMGVLFALVLAVGFAGGVSVGAAGNARMLSNLPLIGDGLSAEPDPTLDFTDFWKAYNVLNTRFVPAASSTMPAAEEKLWGAIQGLTASFGDPYTVFLPPEEAQIFEEDISGNFEGVGMEIGLNPEGVLTVIAPLKGTPAERAGLLAGDLILTIDGTSTEGITTDEAVKLIRGEEGTAVTFGILRDGSAREISVTRATIQIPTIDQSYDAASGTYTIALYEFTANSPRLFAEALEDFRASGARNLIVDLRGNPGGYLESAVMISSHFLPRNEVVVTEDYQGHEKNVVHRSSGKGGVPDGTKVVVLIDRGSASASEIVAGALKDNGAATLIGTRSFGKGSVQELVHIGDAALKVTIARWLTPSGASISNGGLEPHIEVPRTGEDVAAGRDPQLERALEFFRTGR